MEIAASFSSRNHASLLKRFDSTDRILDDIDAKLNGVTNSTSHLREADVNEDPGVDVTSIRMFRHHMENQNQDYKSARAPEFNSIDCKPHDSSKKAKPTDAFHEKRTNLLQLYDDDINLLRRMLQENTDSSKPQNNSEEKSIQQNAVHRNEEDCLLPRRSVKESETLKREEMKAANVQTLQSPPVNEMSHCTCGCETALEKMTKERDELLARIRRGEASKTSIEERQELERQLHTTKSALFQQRKKSRQQLEDIEEKLEEAQHYYDEKLAAKDEIISVLQEKLASQQQCEPSELQPPPISSPPDNSWMREEMDKKDEEIVQLTNLVAKQNQALNGLQTKLKTESTQSAAQTNEKVILERKKWEEKINELKLKSETEKMQNERNITRLEEEKQEMCSNISDVTKKMEIYRQEIENMENKNKNEILQKENDYKATTELLKSKIESLKEELSHAFASKSELELDFRRQETTFVQESRAKEMELREENKRLDDEVQQMKLEVAQTLAKLKDFKTDIEHQDQSLAGAVYDECRKLSALLQNIQSSTNIARKSHVPKGNLICKRAVCELQDIVDSVSRASNDLICELTRIRREARKRGDFMSLRNSSDVTMASEEAKLLREKLNAKDSELHDMQINMNQWKDLTAQRLAEKFQEELQLQVERKMSAYRNEHVHKSKDKKPEMGRFSKSTNNLSNGSSSNHQPHGDTSTMKLLCHLQGRVKQLRTENDLLRSSNYIKSLDGR